MRINNKGFLPLPNIPAWVFWLAMFIIVGLPSYAIIRLIELGCGYVSKHYQIIEKQPTSLSENKKDTK